MLYEEIRKETYIWIQSIFEGNFELIEDPKLFLNDLSEAVEVRVVLTAMMLELRMSQQ